MLVQSIGDSLKVLQVLNLRNERQKPTTGALGGLIRKRLVQSEGSVCMDEAGSLRPQQVRTRSNLVLNRSHL